MCRDLLERQREVLECLSRLPRNVMAMHELENVSEFILHDLCHEHCFNMMRAAYFVDNPDFKCLKGVAGFSRDEAYVEPDYVWKNPKSFTQFMQKSAFNQRVRALLVNYDAMRDELPVYLAQHVAPEFGFSHPLLRMWDLKHDNHGLIVFEREDSAEELFDEHFMNGLYVLGFCPVY